ncbi:MAG: hypothetical protein RLZZ471_298 [Actinomycetota bacterium]|jgi:hypothetical protein
MRKLFAILSMVALTSTIAVTPAIAAPAKPGGTCAKVNTSTTISKVKYVCKKSGTKLIWTKASAPAPVFATLWDKYSWTKPTDATAVASAATAAFTAYTATKRNPNVTVKVVAQTGVDQTLISWVTDGSNLIAQTFAYPALSRPFVDVIAIDETGLQTIYKAEGFTDNEIQDRVGGFKAGSPAFGGSKTNTWNYTTIKNSNLMTNDRAGTAQTAGHEFFHAIQEMLATRNPGPLGEEIPNWFWEGPAMFIGLQATNKLGINSYATEGRQWALDRFRGGQGNMKSLPLVEVKANDGKIDPYGIGEIATEFLVSKIGIEKLLAIYSNLGKGQTFATAFANGSGIALADFYSMFEEVRGVLGVPKS